MAKTFSVIISAFLIAVVAIAFLQIIADDINRETDGFDRINETIDVSTAYISANEINTSKEFQITKYPGATDVENEDTTSFVLYNDTTQESAATDTTDYVFTASTGIFTLKNTSYWHDTVTTNTSSTDYTWYHSDYIQDGLSRGIIALVIIFGALVVFIGVGGPVIKHANSVTSKLGRKR